VKLNLSSVKNQETKREIKKRLGELLVDEINGHLDRSTSPVKGGGFKKKKADNSSSQLFEDGDMRSQITFEEHPQGIKVGIFDSAPEVDRLKSHNHNLGVTLPERQFIPEPGEVFKQTIINKMKSVVREVTGKTKVSDIIIMDE
jgi:hypothetical protein